VKTTPNEMESDLRRLVGMAALLAWGNLGANGKALDDDMEKVVEYEMVAFMDKWGGRWTL
jgi:hypothetical protein